MSARGNVEVWVDATEEVIASEECHTSTVMEPTDTPIQKLLDTMVGEGGGGEEGEEEGFYDDGFDCHECRSMFQNQTDPNEVNGPSFILDSPTIMGGPQRALLSLPHGLMMARSSIPNAGLGIVNQGPTVSPGMHFGPYEGEVTTRADAMGSEYSWEICKGKDKWEYIDGASEMHSNWMRYVNCARNEQEKNLLVVQYKDSVMFHCCRPVQQGDELLVWPSDTLLSHLSPAWNQIWFMKQTPTATETTSTSMAYQNFSCLQCQLPFTTETYLQRHTEEFHTVRKKEKETPTTTSVVVLAVDQDPDPTKAKLCPDCGKTFKLDHQLARHQRCVHSNKKPYSCPLCRQSFSQASGLLRHQLIHRKAGTLIRESVAEPSQSDATEESETVERSVTGDTEQHDDTEEPEGMEGDDEMVMDDDVDYSPDEQAETVKTRRAKSGGGANMCSECGKGFTHLGYLKKHKLTVHNHVRPYVCTVCRKSFGQHHDLARHLKQHKVKRSKTKVGHWCASCSLTFSTAHSLRQHAILLHLPREDPDVNALPDDDDQGDDPDFVIEPSVAKAAKSGKKKSPTKRRPQRKTGKRKGAKKTAAAITKLISPKRKGGKKAAATDPEAELSGGEPEASTTKAVAKKRKGGKAADVTYPQAEEGGGEPEASTTKPIAKKRKGGKKTAVIDPQAEEGGGEPEEGGVEAEEGGVETEEGGVEAEEGGVEAEEGGVEAAEGGGEAEEGGVEAEEGGGEEEEGGDEPEEEGDEPEESSASTSPQKAGKPRKWYICVQCKGTYESPGDLKAHKCTATQHTCIQCGMVFKKSGYLKRHEKTVHADAVKSYRCDHCQTVFKKLSKLKLHQESCENHHYMSELFPCDYCEFSFTLKSYLRKHIRRHHPVEYISNPNDDDGGVDQPEDGENLCPHCGKIYVSIKHFKAHACFQEMRVVFLCTDCGKGFSNHYGLKQHQRIHTGEKPYKCPHCVKAFSYVGQLNVHIRTHTGEKPYLCTHCGESFRQSGDLKRHERKHTGVKPHHCPTCSKSFSRLQSLKAHELLHLGQRKFTCSQCPWSFSRNYHLRRHHQKMHS